ncbi:MAG: hypothetical protein E6Q97_29550 [Desulfurellales bacterium]|nr:MAG: hypothetical protein E6Q97_29550 [Desulfurellales bacterium]
MSDDDEFVETMRRNEEAIQRVQDAAAKGVKIPLFDDILAEIRQSNEFLARILKLLESRPH